MCTSIGVNTLNHIAAVIFFPIFFIHSQFFFLLITKAYSFGLHPVILNTGVEVGAIVIIIAHSQVYDIRGGFELLSLSNKTMYG